MTWIVVGIAVAISAVGSIRLFLSSDGLGATLMVGGVLGLIIAGVTQRYAPAGVLLAIVYLLGVELYGRLLAQEAGRDDRYLRG